MKPKKKWSHRTRILASNFESLIPNETMNPEFRDHMEFDKNTFALSIGKSVGIYAKSLHHTEGTGNSWDLRLITEAGKVVHNNIYLGRTLPT